VKKALGIIRELMREVNASPPSEYRTGALANLAEAEARVEAEMWDEGVDDDETA
jgi:hypothetical protein